MSTQLHTALKEILAMPYFKNEPARSGKVINGHEDAISIRLEEQGFIKLDNAKYTPPKQKSPLSKTVMHEWAATKFQPDFFKSDTSELFEGLDYRQLSDMPKGSFIAQPAGKQSFPDFLIRDFDGRFIALEAKSSDKEYPMWNDSLPKLGGVYVLSSGKLNKTTVFLASDVITQAEHDLVAQQEDEIAPIVDKYRKQMKELDVKNRGFHQKSRKQHFQGGGAEKTNYFTHKDRQTCENNVLSFALAQ